MASSFFMICNLMMIAAAIARPQNVEIEKQVIIKIPFEDLIHQTYNHLLPIMAFAKSTRDERDSRNRVRENTGPTLNNYNYPRDTKSKILFRNNRNDDLINSPFYYRPTYYTPAASQRYANMGNGLNKLFFKKQNNKYRSPIAYYVNQENVNRQNLRYAPNNRYRNYQQYSNIPASKNFVNKYSTPQYPSGTNPSLNKGPFRNVFETVTSREQNIYYPILEQNLLPPLQDNELVNNYILQEQPREEIVPPQNIQYPILENKLLPPKPEKIIFKASAVKEKTKLETLDLKSNSTQNLPKMPTELKADKLLVNPTSAVKTVTPAQAGVSGNRSGKSLVSTPSSVIGKSTITQFSTSTENTNSNLKSSDTRHETVKKELSKINIKQKTVEKEILTRKTSGSAKNIKLQLPEGEHKKIILNKSISSPVQIVSNVGDKQSLSDDREFQPINIALPGKLLQRIKVVRGGIAIVGPRGVATASDGGTAIVGPDGVAYTKPNAIAIVGPGSRVVSLPVDLDFNRLISQLSKNRRQEAEINDLSGEYVLNNDGTTIKELFLPTGGKVVATGPIIYHDRPQPNVETILV